MIFLRNEKSYTNKHRWIAMKAYGYPTRAHKHSYKLRLLQFFISDSKGGGREHTKLSVTFAFTNSRYLKIKFT